MNRRQFIANTCAASITSPLLAGSLNNTSPKFKDGITTFKIPANNAWLKDSIFKTNYFRTNLGENTESRLVYGEEVINMSSIRGYASRLNDNEPLESVISRSLNDLESSIYRAESDILIDSNTIPINNKQLDDGVDISIDGVLESIVPGTTDVYLSTNLFDKFFGHIKNGYTPTISSGAKIHKGSWFGSLYIEYNTANQPRYNTCNIACVNKNIGSFIRFVPYSARFITIEYEYNSRHNTLDVSTYSLYALRHFNTKIYTGFLNDVT